MKRTALLIVNRKSRSGETLFAAIHDGLRAHGIDPVPCDCGHARELSPRIEAQGRGAALVVVAGGDGTLNAAAAGVIGLGVPMGIVPAGTANDLARTLGIPLDPDAAIRTIAEGRPARIDVGSVNGHPFFNVASIGLSSDLARGLTRDVKRRFGRFGYALTAMKVLARARPFRADIAASAKRHRALTWQVAVGNGRFYGGGNVVHRDAEIDDGQLDLYSLEFSRAWHMLRMLTSFRSGEHDALREVTSLRGEAFEIRTRRPLPVNADGEIVTQTPATFTVLPRAIAVMVPRERRADAGGGRAP